MIKELATIKSINDQVVTIAITSSGIKLAIEKETEIRIATLDPDLARALAAILLVAAERFEVSKAEELATLARKVGT